MLSHHDVYHDVIPWCHTMTSHHDVVPWCHTITEKLHVISSICNFRPLTIVQQLTLNCTCTSHTNCFTPFKLRSMVANTRVEPTCTLCHSAGQTLRAATLQIISLVWTWYLSSQAVIVVSVRALPTFRSRQSGLFCWGSTNLTLWMDIFHQ